MPRFQNLRQPLGKILQEDSECCWLCYQILRRLGDRNPDVLQNLENQYGSGYGRGGGAHYRPDSAISQCLQDWAECVDVQYLSGKNLQIANIEASGERMGIYRWIGPTA